MKYRVTIHETEVGQPLPWDVFSQDGVLLLSRGQIIQTPKSLMRLIEDGLFLQQDEFPSRSGSAIAGKPSALTHLVDARRILVNILDRKPESIEDFPGRMDQLVKSVRSACDTHVGVCLSSILLMHDQIYAVKHSIDTAILSYLLCKELSLDEPTLRATVAAALTMNFAMYEVQEKIHSISGPLNDKLMDLIRTHPTLGAERLVKAGITDEKWLTAVRQHHEANDGSGYPAGLLGDAIGIGARILSVTDKYCAMVSSRNYRKANRPNAALSDLYVKQGQKIDIAVASKLVRLIGVYPVGTLVRLKSSEIGVVVGPGEDPDTPLVNSVIGRSGHALDKAVPRKTSQPEFAIEDVMTLEKVSIPISMTFVWGESAKIT